MVSYEKFHRWCGQCATSTLHYRRATNHVLHLLVTILFCGWWAPVWAMAAFKIGGWRCETCGYRGSLLLRLGLPVACVASGLTVGGWVLSELTAPGPRATEQPSPGEPVAVAEEETPGDATGQPVAPPLGIEITGDPGASQATTVDGREAQQPSESADVPAVKEVAMEPEEPLADVDQPAVEYRTWTDDTGEHKTVAVFLSYGMGQVTIEKEDGETVKLSMDRLSEADQAWVREHISKR